MAKTGQLRVEDFGASMPVTGEAVQKPPFYYRNMEMMFITYRTDEAAALAWLPEALELDEPALATVIVAYYGASTFGPYHEAMLSIRARMDGEVVSYYPALFTDNEAPLIGGREIWGFAKKLAQIQIRHESEVMMGTVERPTGNRLLTATMRKVTAVAPEDFVLTPSISLKMFPCATDNPRPALAQLIRSELGLVPHMGSNGVADLWTGPGSLHYDTPSVIDPWCALPVHEVVGCYAGTFDAVLGYGTIAREL
ncbi:MAG: acetoacetate decarboxylase family protein [Gammaproteobacteria bacterium]